MRIRLSDADRARFGCEEWLDLDLTRVTNREAVTLQQAFGYDDSRQLADAFTAQWPLGEDGLVDLAQARTDYNAWDSMVWLALRHAGLLTAQSRRDMAAELDGIEYQVVGVRLGGDTEPEGKDESSTPSKTSPTSSARTRQRSSRRSTGSAGTK